MKLFLRDDIATNWAEYSNPFAAASRQQGQVFRELEGRKTLRFELNGKAFFLKLHRGIGWREIIKNIISLRLPVIGAQNEFDAIELLEKNNIPTMRVAAFGKKGINPAKQLSFIVTDEIEYELTLEDLIQEWKIAKPLLWQKKQLFERVAQMSAAMHAAGLNHRDFYLCHFLLAQRGGADLFIIDLHRAQIRRKVPRRWRSKDLSGLYFSSLDAGFTDRDYIRFIQTYLNISRREAILTSLSTFWLDVQRKGLQLYAKECKKRSSAAQ